MKEIFCELIFQVVLKVYDKTQNIHFYFIQIYLLFELSKLKKKKKMLHHVT